MFSTSSQRKFWTFNDESELAQLREKHNLEFIAKHGAHVDEYQRYNVFLSPEEERLLLKQYELHLKEFCKRFSPPMPKGVVGTAFHYFKRFYLYNSTMDFHPKEILATCVYLSCKVEEFNVSIGHLANPERLRGGIDEFLEKVFLTDGCLLYAPSQIALAAVLHAASKEQENLDSYVTEMLFRDAGPDKLAILIEAVRKIRSLVKMVESPAKERVRIIDKKLDRCRNEENNPDSEIYKRRMREALDEDDLVYTGQTRMSLDTSGITQFLSFGYCLELSMCRALLLFVVLAAILFMAEAQLTFTPNWGKRSLGRDSEGCKPGETLLAIYKLIESEAERLLACQKLKNANTSGKVILDMTSIRLERVGNLDIQVRQHRHQFFLVGFMWTSHCRILSEPRSGFCSCRPVREHGGGAFGTDAR
ncbi:hypothetical protein MSG28_011682, partial [Choristoneura fumiferana]